jgi:hypothetical protein
MEATVVPWPAALGRALSASTAASSIIVAAATAEAGQDCASANPAIVVHDPAACAGAERLVEMTRDALCRSTQRDPPESIELSLGEAEDEQRVARLDVHYPDGRTTSRELRGTCGPLLEALGIVLWQIVDLKDQERPIEVGTKAPAEIRPERPAARVAGRASMKHHDAQPLSWTSHAGVTALSGLLPGLAARSALGFSLVMRVPFALELRLDGGPFLPQAQPFIRYLALEGQLSACPGQATLGRTLSVKPCALLAVTHVDGATFGIRRSAGGSALVPSLGAAVLASLDLGSFVGVYVELGILARLNRASWFVNERVQIHRLDAFGAQASAGMLLRL